MSGGLAVDCGVHEFDLQEWLTACRVERVQAWAVRSIDPGLEEAGDVATLQAVLELDGGALATVDLSRHARYGEDVRTEVLGTDGALFVETLPAGRTRIGTVNGMSVVPGSTVADPMAAGVRGQATAFATAVRGGHADLPGAEASARATEIALAVQESVIRGAPVELG